MERFGITQIKIYLNLSINQKNTNIKLQITRWVIIYNSLVLKAKKLALRNCPLIICMLFSTFYAEIRKNNGEDYGPNSLTAMQD